MEPKAQASLAGPSGRVMCVYREAATLGAWRMERGAGGIWSFRGDVLTRSPYWLGQRKLTLELDIGGHKWCWALGEFEIGVALTTTLTGAPESVRAA